MAYSGAASVSTLPGQTSSSSSDGANDGYAKYAGITSDMMAPYLNLVFAKARKISVRLPSHVQSRELITAGMVGLAKALLKRDAFYTDKQFLSYLMRRISGEILDYLKSMDYLTRKARHHVRRAIQITDSLEMRLERAPTSDEVAEELGVDINKFMARGGKSGYVVLSLDAELRRNRRFEKEGQEEPLLFNLEDESQTQAPLRHLIEKERTAQLLRAVETLPENERRVIQLYYFDGLTMNEVGVILGRTQSRIGQIHASAIPKLRRYLERNRFNGLDDI